MTTKVIQRQYDEVIAPFYDLDTQLVYKGSHDLAVAQILRALDAPDASFPLRALDVGIGTGLFLTRLKAESGRRLHAHGLDQSAKMIEVARNRLPDLTAVVDDAQNLGSHFIGDQFDVISTHYITGYVAVDVLAPIIWDRLAPGGVWSILGGTMEGFPALQKKAESKIIQYVFGGKKIDVRSVVCNPANRAEFVTPLQKIGFSIREAETFRPPLRFRDLNEFLEFAHYGGWLTPFVETMGLDKAKGLFRFILNRFVFPVEDHHSIEVILAQKQ